LPRTTLTGNPPHALNASGVSTPGTLLMSFIAADVGNGNQFVATGNDILLIWNSDGAITYTVSILSAPDQYGRKADITNYSLAAGEHDNILITNASLFKQADGNVYVNGSNVAVKFYVLNII
jgi:hypothetical protein